MEEKGSEGIEEADEKPFKFLTRGLARISKDRGQV